ncbi:MAG TPA: AbrB/MazE/SpoVT family DNA-binding domain-containing protein [Bacillales bacterium]
MADKKTSGRLTSKGQVTIPAEVRRDLNLEKGDRIEFVREESGTYAVKPVKKKSIRDSFGILQTDLEAPEDFEEIRRIVHQKIGEAYAENDLNEENKE